MDTIHLYPIAKGLEIPFGWSFDKCLSPPINCKLIIYSAYLNQNGVNLHIEDFTGNGEFDTNTSSYSCLSEGLVTLNRNDWMSLIQISQILCINPKIILCINPKIIFLIVCYLSCL